MFKLRYTLYLLILLAFSCTENNQDFADTVITNANVYTLNWGNPSNEGKPAIDAPIKNGDYMPDANSIAIKNGKIMAVSKEGYLESWINEKTKIIDVKRAFVIPGLIESHGHLNEIGEKKEAIDVRGLGKQEIISLIEKKSKDFDKNEWIVASGWDEAEFANDYPNMIELSEKVSDNPVVLIGLRGFGVMGNALAFKLANITKDSHVPEGGKILLNSRGNLNYVLINQAKQLLLNHIPPKTLAQNIQTMSYGFDKLLRLGFTTTHHLGVDKSHMEVYQYLEKNKKLPMRVHAFIAARKYNLELVNKWLERGPTKTDSLFLQVRGFKGYYDGSLGSRGAKFLDSYSDKTGTTGVSGKEYGFDSDMLKSALNKGFQLAIHAIGDKANRDVLDLYENYFETNPKAKNLRHRIEHVQVVHPDDFKRFSKLNIIASMEPAHAVEDMPWAIDRIGLERAKGAYAWRTLRKNNTKLIFNSDFTGSDPSFFYGLYSAITKKNLKDGNVYFKEQALTREETLRAYTIWAAYASKQENVTGTIEEGKWADLTIINVDILNASPEEIINGKVLTTIVNGEVKFNQETQN